MARSLSSLGGRRVSLAYDRSVRRVDKDGHLFVETCTLSSAVISEYWGWEIPDAGRLGFEPDRMYRLYRDADALRASADTLNGKPIMMEHITSTADAHPKDQVIGAVGSDVHFDFPRLVGSLSFWAPEAISAIQSGKMRSVSAGYRYRAIREAGFLNGEPYDGVMTDIHFNHLALVAAPRVPDAVIGDSLPSMDFKKMATDLENIIQERMDFLRDPSSAPDREQFNASWLAKLDAALGVSAPETAMDRRPAVRGLSSNTGWRSSTTPLAGVLAPASRIKVL
ncbi:phage-like protein [Acetobacter nitrogenifigens DSM 23921 = NBRC 105050]|uniref:Uncharacterized protein n=1 Tax=Acetobacter nitrogenifigens DSM 23921 = NBRC 105050 TaxID=1120919 RepID=A0A511XD28_9PROT|nr:DUF2213 domain-containing protein [Acetobacter nitrogenifigens]GBQ91481.1 phage-like protein [Acetobacter nitrogenifigens DSM 23921 = NBRC 105050]GEN60858.1 hypothetical protein ANI02nite_27420 [Acetobacter nitrogenifigens DSM 23921 = NBRC 105050]